MSPETLEAFLPCEGSCSYRSGRNGNGKRVTMHRYADRRKEMVRMRDAEKSEYILGWKLLYACVRCGHQRVWGVEIP